MPRRFALTSSPVELVLELASNPRTFADLLQLLDDIHFTGQILFDFHRGRPRKAAFPVLERVPLLDPSTSSSSPSASPAPDPPSLP